MQEQAPILLSRETEFRAAMALSLGRTRLHVLGFLVSERRPAHASRIARETGLDRGTVIGALRGIRGRVTAERSLMTLGLVREVPPEKHAMDLKSYETTDEGRATWKALETSGDGRRLQTTPPTLPPK